MTAEPPFVVPPDVGWTGDEGDDGGRPRVFVAPLPGGPIAVLAGTAALTWLAAVEGAGAVVEEVADVTGHSSLMIREDVESFLEEVCHRGLLIRAG